MRSDIIERLLLEPPINTPMSVMNFRYAIRTCTQCYFSTPTVSTLPFFIQFIKKYFISQYSVQFSSE